MRRKNIYNPFAWIDTYILKTLNEAPSNYCNVQFDLLQRNVYDLLKQGSYASKDKNIRTYAHKTLKLLQRTGVDHGCIVSVCDTCESNSRLTNTPLYQKQDSGFCSCLSDDTAIEQIVQKAYFNSPNI